MSLLQIHNRIGVALFIACAASTTQACGPFFPNQVIAGYGADNLTDIPAGQFDAEIRELKSPVTPVAWQPTDLKFKGGPSAWSAKVDVDELTAVLSENKMTFDPKALEEYRRVREQIAAYVDGKDIWSAKRSGELPALAVPAGLPTEFELYLKGLVAFNRKDVAGAQKDWTDLLALPLEKRKHRSAWAAFMLGKSYITPSPVADPAKAVQYFELTRKLIAEGCTDRLDVGPSSLGWQAKAELDAGHVVSAVQLYIKQNGTGKDADTYSLHECARRAMAGTPDALITAANDPDTRQVITAYLISDLAPWATLSKEEKAHIPEWLTAVESAAVKDMTGADRLAWCAYSGGDFAAAARWVARSPRESVVAGWVRSKLLLREGKTDEAAKELIRVVRSFPQAELVGYATVIDFDVEDPYQTVPQHIATDLGVLQLKRGQYADSMRLLMMADHWRDAAYIAERVLTTDELKAFVDRFCPEQKAPRHQHEDAKAPAWQESSRDLRLLLARRLTREGDWKVARDYFTADLQPKLDQYIQGIRDGHDKTKPDADRAAAYRVAARTAYNNGMDLLGTELAPDFHWYGGSFKFDDEKDRQVARGITAPTADELARFKNTEPGDTRRFHYRYIAADYAWDAAELMPDDDEQTAKWLNESGTWLKARDPKLADKYYKALVRRCPDTDLGKQAAALHWFPPNATAGIRD